MAKPARIDGSDGGAEISSEHDEGRARDPFEPVADSARRFRSANKFRLVDGAPADSTLGAEERAAWCRKLMPLARDHLPRTGDTVEGEGACAFTLIPKTARQLVPGVTLRFDLGFFFAKPYAAASYDREAGTLFLPLAALTTPWDEVGATRHEWLHATVHARARSGDPTALALQTTVTGRDYRPDGFYADEVLVNLCDVVQAAKLRQPPRAEQMGMLEQYVGMLRKELDTMKRSRGKGTAASRAGVFGVHLASTDGVERWVGGKDPSRSLAILEGVWKDASAALRMLSAEPINVAGASALPLVAGDACEPGSKR